MLIRHTAATSIRAMRAASFGRSLGPSGRQLEPPARTNANADRFGEAEQCVLEHGKLETVGDGRSDLFRLDQVRLAQDCKMGRERWLGSGETRVRYRCIRRRLPLPRMLNPFVAEQ